MALSLVRANSDKSSLTKGELWEVCQQDDACTIPTKRQLGVALGLLRQQDLLHLEAKGVLRINHECLQ
jgi:hypothetical protein